MFKGCEDPSNKYNDPSHPAVPIYFGGKEVSMTSFEMRDDPLFMRNEFQTQGKWGIPLVRKQNLNMEKVELIACSDTKHNETEENRRKGVHFFVDDYRFEGIYSNPQKTLTRYSQYAFLLTPEFSTYADMDLWRQIESTAKNRWVGAYWQSKGLTVVPSICWSTARSFDFCFDGVEKNAIVAVGMIGSKRQRKAFLFGYDAMLERLDPTAIIVFGSPFPEMRGNLIPVDYLGSRKVVH